MEVTDLESSTGFWLTQFALSEETKADVYYYGFIILFLLVLVCLALYFLWRNQIKSFWQFLQFPVLHRNVTFLFQGFLPDIFKVIGLLQYGHSPNMILKLCLLVSSPLNHSYKHIWWKGCPHWELSHTWSGMAPSSW